MSYNSPPKHFLRLFFPLLSLTLPGNGKATGQYYIFSSSETFPFFVPPLQTAYLWNNMRIFLFVLIHVYIIIIIIMSYRQHRYLLPSLATPPYRSSLLAGLQGYIPYPHIAAVCRFELAVLLLLGHMWGSTGVRHL